MTKGKTYLTKKFVFIVKQIKEVHMRIYHQF